VRVLLDLMRENDARVQGMAAACAQLLEHSHLKVLDPEVGDQELIKAVAEAWAKLRG